MFYFEIIYGLKKSLYEYLMIKGFIMGLYLNILLVYFILCRIIWYWKVGMYLEKVWGFRVLFNIDRYLVYLY